LHQVGVSFDLYYDARKHKIKTVRILNNVQNRWTGRVARMVRGVVQTGFRWDNPKESDHLEDLGVERKILRSEVGTWTGFVWLRIGTDGGIL